jgi:hypothetical protein
MEFKFQNLELDCDIVHNKEEYIRRQLVLGKKLSVVKRSESFLRGVVILNDVFKV